MAILALTGTEGLSDQRVQANQHTAAEKGNAATEQLKKMGVVFTPMAKSEREQVRKEMDAKVWASFIKEYPTTKPLFEAISAART